MLAEKKQNSLARFKQICDMQAQHNVGFYRTTRDEVQRRCKGGEEQKKNYFRRKWQN